MTRLVERVADLQYKVFDSLRNGAADEVAEGDAKGDFGVLEGARQCVLVSFKGSGEPVPTPVNFGLSEDGHAYFRSEPRSAKVRRIRNTPRVRIAPCNLRGKPTGPPAEGKARVLAESENERAERIVAANWAPWMRPIERGLDMLPLEMVYVEVSPE